MARRLTRSVVAALTFAAAVALLAGCGGSSSGEASGPGLADRKVTIGGLEVTVTPARLDAGGADFKVVFDTHTGAPEIDVAANAALVVGGTPWTDAAWSGDGPGDHHLEGTLSFTAAAPPGHRPPHHRRPRRPAGSHLDAALKEGTMTDTLLTETTPPGQDPKAPRRHQVLVVDPAS